MTPFAPRALDRGLSGAWVSLVRLAGIDLNDNDGASRANREHEFIRLATEQLTRRAGKINGTGGEQLVQSAIAARIDKIVLGRASGPSCWPLQPALPAIHIRPLRRNGKNRRPTRTSARSHD